MEDNRDPLSTRPRHPQRAPFFTYTTIEDGQITCWEEKSRGGRRGGRESKGGRRAPSFVLEALHRLVLWVWTSASS